jgi:hypothetical protein
VVVRRNDHVVCTLPCGCARRINLCVWEQKGEYTRYCARHEERWRRDSNAGCERRRRIAVQFRSVLDEKMYHAALGELSRAVPRISASAGFRTGAPR